jgi:hypothetical protein
MRRYRTRWSGHRQAAKVTETEKAKVQVQERAALMQAAESDPSSAEEAGSPEPGEAQ